MDKKHISIIGSCVSREMFNMTPLQENFIVDKYAFKTCVWDLFSKGFDIDAEVFSNLKIPEFAARMLRYEFNKCTLDEVESAKSEYLMVDFLNVHHFIDKIEYQGNVIYFQDTYDKLSLYKDSLLKLDLFQKMTFERIKVSDFEIDTIKKGISDFADWVKKHYKEENVIVNKYDVSRLYYDADNHLQTYNIGQWGEYFDLHKFVMEITDYFIGQFDSVKVLQIPNSPISQFGFYDVPRGAASPVHYTTEYYCEMALTFLNLVNVRADGIFNKPVSPLGYECVKLKNVYLKSLDSVRRQAAEPKKCVRFSKTIKMNDYFFSISNMEDVIVILVAKDEAASNYRKFDKQVLGLSCSLKWRDSYVALIDKKRDVVWERASQEKVEYDYCIGGNSIRVESAGWNVGNKAVVSVNGSGNLCKNERGINIVLLNSKTLEVVDSANCDTFADESLTVRSDYFSNMKIDVK